MSAEELERLRHSASHVMAEAVLKLFPDAKFGIGPAIEHGFYYDFELPRPLSPEDLDQIKALMKESIKARQTFEREEVTIEEARQVFADQPYKLELLDALPEGETISIYRHGDFVDLCRGPHLQHTGRIKANAIELLSIAGAY